MDELDLEIAASQSVAEVMIKRPKTLAAGATVSDARRLLLLALTGFCEHASCPRLPSESCLGREPFDVAGPGIT